MRVLFVGGPLDGTTRDVDRFHDEIVYAPPSLNYRTDGAYANPVVYRRHLLGLFGNVLRLYLAPDVTAETCERSLWRSLVTPAARSIVHDVVPDTVEEMLAIRPDLR